MTTASNVDLLIEDMNRSFQVFTHEDISTEELSHQIFDKLVGNGVSSRIIRYTYNNQPFFSVQYYKQGEWYNFNYIGLDMFFQPVYSRTLNPQDIVKMEMIMEGGVPESMIDTSSPDSECATVKVYPTGESLLSNDVVNIYDDNGTTRVRKADATDNTRPAMGYVKSPVSQGANATVYFDGFLSGLALTVGIPYFLSTTPGQITPNPPVGTGNVWQKIGDSIDTDNIEFEPEQPVTRG